jgi:methylated-DNA-[protein]-cysteine S-methyltransferase
MKLTKIEIDSPAGRLYLAATEKGVCALLFAEPRGKSRAWLERRFGRIEFEDDPVRADVLRRAADALSAYFDGDREALRGIPVDGGGTDFQRKVWSALRRIPAGQTRTYGEIARQVGRPAAVRAVGMANRTNPVAIVVPCHRVIGAGGKLTGYGGGLARKEWLLRHEGAIL